MNIYKIGSSTNMQEVTTSGWRGQELSNKSLIILCTLSISHIKMTETKSPAWMHSQNGVDLKSVKLLHTDKQSHIKMTGLIF